MSGPLVNTALVSTMTIGIESLLLDPLNPRHEAVTGQSEAIGAIIDEQGPKLTQLAKHIAEHGLNPLDRVLVYKSGKNYVVLEGNRRIAALKLLNNPALADGTPLASEIRKIAAKAHSPKDVECSVVGSREAAKPWLVLRHSGEQEGRGVVPWNAVASARFSAAPGSREARWVSFVDGAQAAFPENTRIQEAIETIMAGRITTLGRLYSDPDFRDHLGLEDDDGGLQSHYAAADLEPTLERVLTDLAGDLSVTKIKSKDQRAKYLAALPKPRKSAYQAQAQPLTTTRAATTAGTRARPSRRATRPGSPFKNLDLRNLDMRIDDIVLELRKLDLDKFPNAAAVLARVLFELSLDQFIAKKKLSLSKQNPKLKDKLKRCLREVDPTDKDDLYQGVRAGLADSTSIYAVSTLHGYVHNKDFHPTPTDIRGIASNLKPFLQAMNDAL